MRKLRKFAVAVLAVCAVASATAALAACTQDNYPDYKNPVDEPVNPGPGTEGKVLHTINVKSLGGLYLNNVQVNIEQNGQHVASGISRSGKIEAYLIPGEYDLKVDETTLPDGYYLPENANFKIEAATDETEEDDKYKADVSLPSSVILTAAESTKTYRLGDVMHDFAYTDASGNRHLLSDTLKSKRAVVLNFWYINCTYCNLEFPDLQETYNSYKGTAEVIALNHTDSAPAIRDYQETNGYDFHMVYDTTNVTGKFDFSGYPTTVVVDRYGVVAYQYSGAIAKSRWRSLFAMYTADNYTQDDIATPPTEDDPGDTSKEWVKPEGVATPDYYKFKELLGNSFADEATKFYSEPNEEDAEANWPWTVDTHDGRITLTATNAGADPSYAILYIDLSLKKGDIVSYDYNVLNDENFEALYVIMKTDPTAPSGDLLKEYNGTSDGWQTENAVYTAHRDENVTLTFTFYKTWGNGKVSSADNFAMISNLSVMNVEEMTDPVDFALGAHEEGITEENIYLADDGFYRLRNTGKDYLDGNLLLIDLWGKTTWSTNHAGMETFAPEGSGKTYYASMYHLSFWGHSNRTDDEKLRYDYLTGNESDFLNEMLNLQNFSESRYLPVTAQLRTILEKFCAMFKDDPRRQGEAEYYQTEWIEMCYVYRHYNGKHENAICFATDDPVEGMAKFNAFTAVEYVGTEQTVNHANVKTLYSHNGHGVYFKFNPSKPGVYRFSSSANLAAAAPTLYLEYTVTGANGTKRTAGRTIAEDVSVGALETPGTFGNFFGYNYFENTDTVYILAALDSPNATGAFDFTIEYVGESYDWLRYASTGGGMFVGTDGNFSDTVYMAIPWGWNDDEQCYYAMSGNEFTTPIYIDFLHANYYEQNNHSLYEMIRAGYFNLGTYFRPDYTSAMLEFYEKSIEGKEADDPLYGMLEADYELVNMIADVFFYRGGNGDALESGYWLSVACYYQHFGPAKNAD